MMDPVMESFDPYRMLPDFVTFRGLKVPIAEHRGHYRLDIQTPDGKPWSFALYKRAENGQDNQGNPCSVDVWQAQFWATPVGIGFRTGSQLFGVKGEDAIEPQAAVEFLEQALREIDRAFPKPKHTCADDDETKGCLACHPSS